MIEQIKTEIKTLIQKNADGDSFEFRILKLLSSATGSFVNGYHLELTVDDIDYAHEICDELAAHDVFANIAHSAGHARVYIKDSESICNLFAFIGATKSLCDLNNKIAMRDVRNNSNRRANCDAANIEKQIEAAREQTEILTALIDTPTYKTLPKRLRETLHARINNPSASYEELAKILGISKSGVVHRINRLCGLL